MARYEDVLVGGEGLRYYIQDLWSKLVERERLGGLLLLLLDAQRLHRWTNFGGAVASTYYSRFSPLTRHIRQQPPPHHIRNRAKPIALPSTTTLLDELHEEEVLLPSRQGPLLREVLRDPLPLRRAD